uniref:Kinesin motor domain-containing protein n=1 Tax=Globisporangium ultimum (strain ATCC 200006 / CBS 805.95 / DAOM BR144) TaxID=431595 RepID=K3W5B9_GLOUD
MTERVKVFCRVRPLLQREREGWSYNEFCQQFGDDGDNNNNDSHRQKDQGPETTLVDEVNSCFVTEKGPLHYAASSMGSVVSLGSDGKTILYNPANENKEFVFDASLNESADQERVYQQVGREIVHDVLDGFNGTIFAYGQTSTGKTHTMVGHGDGGQRGVIPRALQDIFARVEATRSSAETRVALSYVQIYCERIFDLLDPERPHSSIVIREDSERGVYLDGASCISVTSVAECLSHLDRGNANRAVASTGMNAHSSRSHAILILRIERKEYGATNTPNRLIKLSNLYLVDLAGSERVKKSKVMGRHVNELKAINLSLSALGNCIAALSSKQPKKHVPYRDSKLTRLLQSSLGGNAKTALVITISPSPTEAHETLSTMLFGQRAMQVSVNAHCNVLSVLDYKSLYEELQQRLDSADENARDLESKLADQQFTVASLEEQLLKVQLRIQHLEFKNQAGKAALEAHARATHPSDDSNDSSNAGGGIMDPAVLAQQLALLVTKHDEDVAHTKQKCDLQIETYKRLADQASTEWHEVEDALASEKLQALTALQELKEFKLRFFDMEEATTDRIAELVQEVKEKERELREAQDASKTQVATQSREVAALKTQMAEVEKQRQSLQEQMEADFVPRETIEQMEALYERAIAKLQERVGCLETKSMSAGQPQFDRNPQRKPVPPSTSITSNNNNQLPERTNIGGPQKSVSRAIPKIGRLVPGSKAGSMPNGLR